VLDGLACLVANGDVAVVESVGYVSWVSQCLFFVD
jgi:hypothetical protein